MKNRLTKSQLEQLIREQLTEEIRQQLDEGLSDKLKNAYDNVKASVRDLGSLTAGTGTLGRILNPKAAKETERKKKEMEATLNKASSASFKQFLAGLEKEYPDFDKFPERPARREEFLQVLAAFRAYYDSLKAGVDKYKPGQDEQVEGALSPEVANPLVLVAQDYLLGKQEIASGMSKLTLEEDSSLDEDQTISENIFINWEAEAGKVADEMESVAKSKEFKGKSLEDLMKSYDAEASTIKDLKSTALPKRLFLLGAVGYLLADRMLAAAVTKPVLSSFVTDPGRIIENTEQIMTKAATAIEGDTTGSGWLTNLVGMGEGEGANLLDIEDSTMSGRYKEGMAATLEATNLPPEEFFDQWAGQTSTFKDPKIAGELQFALHEYVVGDIGEMKDVVRPGGSDPQWINYLNERVEAGKLSPEALETATKLSGDGFTPGQTWLGVKATKFTIVGKALMQTSIKLIVIAGTVTMVGKTVLGASILGVLGSVLGPVGVGLMTAGALTYLARKKGLKSSRLVELAETQKYFRLFDEKTGKPEEEGGEEGPGLGPYPVVEDSDNICETITSTLRGLNLRVGDTFKFYNAQGQEKGAMVVATEGMPGLQYSFKNGNITEVGALNYEEDCERTSGRFVRFPMLIVFNAEDVQRKIAEKDESGYRGKRTKPTNQPENPSGINTAARVIPKEMAGNPPKKFESILSQAGQKIGLTSTGRLPEGYAIQFNFKDLNQTDENFEAHLKKYTDALVGDDKEERAKMFNDILVPELRKRRGMSDEKPAGKPEDDEASELSPLAKDMAGELGVDIGSGRSALDKGISTDDLLGVGPTGIKNQRGGSKKKVRPPTDAGTIKRRRKTRGGRALEEQDNLQETLDRWAKIAGIIKESKND